jgi:riboflavin synthase
MYTGITRGTFPIIQVDQEPDLASYVLELDADLVAGLERGASICIDGVCHDAIRETLELSTLDTLEVGRQVTVERSARVGDEIGGHDIAGHVHGTGVISDVYREGNTFDLSIAVPAEWMSCIFEKGFIAVDGSSLTVGDVDAAGSFTVHLIPETLRLTNLGRKQKGDRVNIELDARTVAIVRTVERVLGAEGQQGSGASASWARTTTSGTDPGLPPRTPPG